MATSERRSGAHRGGGLHAGRGARGRTPEGRRRARRHHPADRLLPDGLGALRRAGARASSRACSPARSSSSSGERKVALVSADLGFVPAGLVADVAERLERRGFGDEQRRRSRPRTPTRRRPATPTTPPSTRSRRPSTTPTEFEIGTPGRPAALHVPRPAGGEGDRAAPTATAPRAVAGWGETKLFGVTENRSIEAHLANHGVSVEFGQGSPRDGPARACAQTIDPDVNVLRVDKLVGGRRVPIGIWSTFANHGTVVKPTFTFYNADHHAAAARVAEAAIRRARRRPARPGGGQRLRQLRRGRHDRGADVQRPGGRRTRSAGARRRRSLEAWRRAGRADVVDADAADPRWTIECFCGSETAVGPGRRPRGGRAAVPHRLGGEPRAALRRDRRAVRGQPRCRPASGPQGVQDPGGPRHGHRPSPTPCR